jgi:hypothetical protein
VAKSPLLIVEGSLRDPIQGEAAHRHQVKKDVTVYKDGGSTQFFHIMGIVAEMYGGREFGSPWYQNPNPQRGDKHRPGDFQLRNGLWIEAKATRGRDILVYDHTDQRREWDYVFLVRRIENDGWKANKYRWLLAGVTSKAYFELNAKRDSERPAWRCRVQGGAIGRMHEIARDCLLNYPVQPGGEGLRCPWCLNVWPCEAQACVQAMVRRVRWARMFG